MRDDDYDDWDEFVSDANDYLDECSAYLEENFDIGHHDRFDWNQNNGTLIFSNDGVPTVMAKIQFVGSISLESNTWLWAWANDTVLDNVVDQMHVVREYGEDHDFEALYLEQWDGNEDDGWEMAAITAYLLEAEGAYRSSDEYGHTYMVITDIYWLDDD